MKIRFEKREILKEKPLIHECIFGKYFTDYMFTMNYENGFWQDARIIPYGPFEIEPSCLVLHYGQATFEGLKAYKTKNQEIQLFRPQMNAQRMMKSNLRMNMPLICENDFMEAILALVKIEKDWIFENASLYLRPMMFANESCIGNKTSSSYQFMIIACPVVNYYEKKDPLLQLYVEEKQARAFPNGTGNVKASCNYATSLLTQQKAKNLGNQQVLWLDAIKHQYIEEASSMNVMFVIDSIVYTPPLTDTILPGITRDSILMILQEKKIPIMESKINIHWLLKKIKQNRVQEAFGCGTAAMVVPIGSLMMNDQTYFISHSMGHITEMVYDELKIIQNSEKEHPWIIKIKTE